MHKFYNTFDNFVRGTESDDNQTDDDSEYIDSDAEMSSSTKNIF